MMKVLKITSLLLLIGLYFSPQMQAQKLRDEVKAGKKYIIHKVQTGETMYALMRTYGIDKSTLLKDNPGIDKLLKIGQEVKIYNGEADLPKYTAPAEQSNLVQLKHMVQKGEWLSKIAKAYDVDVEELKKWNQLEGETIKPGQELIVGLTTRKSSKKNDVSKGTAANTKDSKKKNLKSEAPTPKEMIWHEVAAGESLSRIKAKYGVSISDIKTWNSLSSDQVNVGDKLKIFVDAKPAVDKGQTDNPFENLADNTTPNPNDLVNPNGINRGSNPSNTPTVSEPIFHTVAPGETIYAIQNKYNVRKTEIRFWNGMPEGSNDIQQGQRLKIYMPKNVTHTVAANETTYSIAQKYDVIPRQIEIWNGLKKNQQLNKGQLLTLFLPTGPKPSNPIATNPDVNKPSVPVQGQYTAPYIYSVKEGDNLYSLQNRYNVRKTEMRFWNNLETDALDVGQKLKIYLPKLVKHSVQQGETTQSIAKQYSVYPAQIEIWNGMKHYKPVKVGQNLDLFLPTGPQPPSNPGPLKWQQFPGEIHNPDNTIITTPTQPIAQIRGSQNPIIHTVGANEYLYDIAVKHKVTVKQLKDWNNLTSYNITPGQKLTIYPNQPQQQPQNYNNNNNNALPQNYNNNNNNALPQNYNNNNNNNALPQNYNNNNNNNALPQNYNNNNNNNALPQNNNNPNTGNPYTGNPYTYSTTSESNDPFDQLNNATMTPSNQFNNNNNNNTPANNNTYQPQNNNTYRGNNNTYQPQNNNTYRGNNNTYQPQNNNTYQPQNNNGTVQEQGLARFQANLPANKPFAAIHRSAPIGTLIIVKNPLNGKSVVVEVAANMNSYNNNGEIIQVSSTVFERLGANTSQPVNVELSYMPRR